MNNEDDMSIDDYFDDEGNLITTAWRVEEEKRQKEEEERLQKESHKNRVKEANRQIAIDNKRAEEKDRITESQRKRIKRDEWMAMPKWVKSMPRIPMNAPPTEGRKEKFIYSLTKKVQLTDNERSIREAHIHRLQLAMDDYKAIHQHFPPGTPLIPVTVIPLGKGIGGTMLTRAMSRAISESRHDLGSTASIDLSNDVSDISEWFGTETRGHVILTNIINIAKNPDTRDLTLTEIFSNAGNKEYYVYNHTSPARRANPDASDIASLYSLMKKTPGIGFFDCDYENIEQITMLSVLARNIIFVLPMSNDAPKMLKNKLREIKEELGDDDELYNEIIQKIMIVVSGTSKKTSTPEGRSVLKKLVHKAAQECGTDIERTFVVPYDQALSAKPLKWAKVRFPTAHTIRKICGLIVNDAVAYGEKNA